MSSKPELVIWSHGTGKQIPCFDSCQLTTTWILNIVYCMIKPRLHGLALGGVWQPCSTELVWIHTTNHVGHEKKELHGFLYLCMHPRGGAGGMIEGFFGFDIVDFSNLARLHAHISTREVL